MRPLLRIQLALAALGAGLIHLGVAAGAPALLLVPLAAIGAAELGWAVATLAREVTPFPRAALACALVPVALQVALLLIPATAHTGGGGHETSPLPAGSLTGATLLDLVVAAGLAIGLRRTRPVAAGRPGTARLLLATAVGALAVATVTATSLAATSTGVPHGH